MEHEQVKKADRAPLRKFAVRVLKPDGDHEDLQVAAHLVFNNKARGEGLIFRRYYDDSVRTEMVAEFQPDQWVNYREIDT